MSELHLRRPYAGLSVAAATALLLGLLASDVFAAQYVIPLPIGGTGLAGAGGSPACEACHEEVIPFKNPVICGAMKTDNCWDSKRLGNQPGHDFDVLTRETGAVPMIYRYTTRDGTRWFLPSRPEYRNPHLDLLH